MASQYSNTFSVCSYGDAWIDLHIRNQPVQRYEFTCKIKYTKSDDNSIISSSCETKNKEYLLPKGNGDNTINCFNRVCKL